MVPWAMVHEHGVNGLLEGYPVHWDLGLGSYHVGSKYWFGMAMNPLS